jgi:hypothetical protein
MKEAGRVRGGVKPPGGRETLEAERSRGVESPAYHRGFPVLRALKGPKALGGTAPARAACSSGHRRGGVRRSNSVGGATS